ncbi:MAG: hypothetical protein V3T19_05100 [Acidiferrobacterales bacterium]
MLDIFWGDKIKAQSYAPVEELLRACLYEQEVLVLLLEEKGILTRSELLEKITL